MTYPKRLLRLRPTKGLALDVPAHEVSPDYWTGGSNIRPRDGVIERVPGSRSAYVQNTADPVHALLNVRAPGGITESNFWLAFSTATIKALETSNITDITGTALTSVSAPWYWAPTLLNNIPCFTNGVDAPRYWGGDVGVAAAALPGWPAGTICKSLVAFKYHLFALDIDGPSGHFESQILWSDAAAAGAVPSTWTAAATNEAGDAILADTAGPCMQGVPLQDTLLVFKRSSLYGVNYIGGDRIYSTRLLDGSRGALTRRSAVNIGGRVFVVADGDIFITDGVNWNSVANSFVRRHLFSQLDQASYENLFVVYDRANEEVRVCYPTTGNTYCNEALVFNLSLPGWGVRTMSAATCAAVGVVNDTAPDESWNGDADTWDSDSTAWNSANFSLAAEQMLVGVNGSTITLEGTEDAVAVAANVQRHDLSMGEPERFKFVKRVHVRTGTSSGTLYVRVGARNSLTDSISWSAEQTLIAPASYVDVLVTGRFVSIQIRSEGSDVWQVIGADMEYEARGYF